MRRQRALHRLRRLDCVHGVVVVVAAHARGRLHSGRPPDRCLCGWVPTWRGPSSRTSSSGAAGASEAASRLQSVAATPLAAALGVAVGCDSVAAGAARGGRVRAATAAAVVVHVPGVCARAGLALPRVPDMAGSVSALSEGLLCPMCMLCARVDAVGLTCPVRRSSRDSGSFARD